MQTQFGPETHEQPCGCKTLNTHGNDPNVPGHEPVYVPCLACALKNAGIMLIEAGKRMQEALDAERLEAENRAEAERAKSEDWIGGND